MLWVCHSGSAVGPASARFFGYAYETCLGKILWACHSGSVVGPASVRFFGHATYCFWLPHICVIVMFEILFQWNVAIELRFTKNPFANTIGINRRWTWRPVLQVGFVSVTSSRTVRTSTSGCSSNTTTFGSSRPCRWTIYRSNICSERYERMRSGTSDRRPLHLAVTSFTGPTYRERK